MHLRISLAALFLFVASACGTKPICNPQTCSTGCCDSSGTCQSNGAAFCGTQGNACVACLIGQICSLGSCQAISGNGGGSGGGSGGGTGGGTGGGAMGGGTGGGATGGGGTTGGGTGGGVTGGGTGGGTTGGGTGGGITGGGAGGGITGGGTGGGTTGGGTGGGTGLGSSCSNPIPLPFGATGVAGAIDMAGKRLYYRVAATAGVTMVFATAANPNDISGTLDTALTLFDASGITMLASDDDGIPRASSDSELFYRSTTSTNLCLMVEDWSTWAQVTPVLPSPNTFTVIAVELLGAPTTVDTEPNDSTPQTATLNPFTMGAGGVTIVTGGLGSSTDVDTYSVTVPSGATRVSVFLPPIGRPLAPVTTSYGSTLQRFGVQLRSGSSVLASLFPPPGDVEATSGELSVPVSPAPMRSSSRGPQVSRPARTTSTPRAVPLRPTTRARSSPTTARAPQTH